VAPSRVRRARAVLRRRPVVVENQEPIKSLAGPVSSGQRTDKTWRTAHCAGIVLIRGRPTHDSASDHRFIRLTS
jgi:hypothetical protein